jgi:hypothetical protein
VKATPVTAAALLLASVIVIVLASLRPTEAGLKVLVAVSSASTVSVSLALAVLEPALVAVTDPAPRVFV